MVEIAPQPPGFIATPLDADNLPPLEQTAVVVPPPGQAAGLDEHAGERGYLRPCSAPAVAPGVGARRLAPRPDDDPAGSPSFRTRGGVRVNRSAALAASSRRRESVTWALRSRAVIAAGRGFETVGFWCRRQCRALDPRGQCLSKPGDGNRLSVGDRRLGLGLAPGEILDQLARPYQPTVAAARARPGPLP